MMDARLLSQVSLVQDLWPRRRMSVRLRGGRDHDPGARLSLQPVRLGVDRALTTRGESAEGQAQAAAVPLPKMQGPALEHATPRTLKSCGQRLDKQRFVQPMNLWKRFFVEFVGREEDSGFARRLASRTGWVSA